MNQEPFDIRLDRLADRLPDRKRAGVIIYKIYKDLAPLRAGEKDY